MDAKENLADDIIKRRGIYFRSFGLYKEVSGFYDYGAIGLRIRRNISHLWRKFFVERLGTLEVETTTIVPEIVLKASGHVATFTDPIALCTKCKTPHRVDKLLEEFYSKKKDDENLKKVRKMTLEQLDEKIRENGIKCEKCGGELAKIDKFNLMFKTEIGAKGGEVGYLRPETAQGIFVDFKDLFRIYGLSLPCSIAQIGKAYRNEISPRQQLVRMREFTQMETELFFDPETDFTEINGITLKDIESSALPFQKREGGAVESMTIKKLISDKLIPNAYFGLLLYLENKLVIEMGFDEKSYRFRQLEKEELPHYSKGNVDLEINSSYGYIEVAGNAHRGDYDLSAHAKLSNNDVGVMSNNKKVVPHVVEASLGLDRLLLTLLDNSVKRDERGWDHMTLNGVITPYLYAIFPLQKDEKIIALARKIYDGLLERNVPCYYSESGSIGKRYAKADEIGIPNCITVDFQSLEDHEVTVRDRDSMKQERKKVDSFTK